MSSKIGLTYVPLRARLDIEDIFDGRPVCLIDQIMLANDGQPDVVGSIIFVVKKGARCGPDGWAVGYFDKCKVTQLAASLARKPDASVPPRQEQLTEVTTLQNVREPDTFSDDDASSNDGAGDWWGESSMSEEEPEVNEHLHDRDVSADFRLISQDDKVDIAKKLGDRIDMARYVVFTSARRNQVDVYWKKREQRMFAQVHLYAADQISQTRGARSFTSTRSCSISYRGLKAALLRAELWQMWHIGLLFALSDWLFLFVVKTGASAGAFHPFIFLAIK